MTLLSQYYRYKGYIFTECSLPYEGWFYVENSKSQKQDFSWVFTERVTLVLGFLLFSQVLEIDKSAGQVEVLKRDRSPGSSESKYSQSYEKYILYQCHELNTDFPTLCYSEKMNCYVVK